MATNKKWKFSRVFSALLIVTFIFSPFVAYAGQYRWNAEDIVKNQTEQTRLVGDKGQQIGLVSNAQIRSLIEIKNGLEHQIDVNRSYALYLTEDSDPNAFATTANGENVIVFTLGMLRLAGNDTDMFAAVMGHEIGHHVKNHLEESYRNNVVVGLAQIILGAWLEQKTQQKYHVQNLGLDITNLTAAMVSSKFSRDQERQADAFGFNLMLEAGYDPDAAVRLHERLKGYAGADVPFLSSHPASDERIQNLKRMIAGNPEAVRLAQSRASQRYALARNNQENISSNPQIAEASTSDYRQAVAAMLKQDYTTALSKFKIAAGNGDANAALHLGYMYQYGKGVVANKSEAVRWFQKSASAGNGTAVGILQDLGPAVDKNVETTATKNDTPPKVPSQPKTKMTVEEYLSSTIDQLGLKLDSSMMISRIGRSTYVSTTCRVGDKINEGVVIEPASNASESTSYVSMNDIPTYIRLMEETKVGTVVHFHVTREKIGNAESY